MLHIDRTRVVLGGVVYTRKITRNADGRGSERVIYLRKGRTPRESC